MTRRALLWAAVTALLVLVARWACYALEPSPLANRFEASAGGPRFLVVTLVSLALAAAVSTAAVWLAVVGVRERQRLRPERELPRVRLRRLTARALGLAVAGSVVFAAFESYLHWHARLGFHGLSCLFGPVHRNALPVIAALALLAAALAEAVQHLHAWMRAAARALLRARLVLPDLSAPRPWPPRLFVTARVVSAARPRAPPLPA